MNDEADSPEQPAGPVLTGDTLAAARDILSDALPLLLQDASARYDPSGSPEALVLDLRRVMELLDEFVWPENVTSADDDLSVEIADADSRDVLRRLAYVSMARGNGQHYEGQAVLDAIGWRYEPLDG